ncbi:hypothetical protein L873DRAFT_859704 [Choiromyces venosus 120613-1]|uniref:Uncharacterized protein n=1 Tax=Choiromyces venosus 120613-1 TaxID=1336337 RepID=A0A3N4JNJ7_9PEZI|nr:hypothetical protein L873DRAFT_859704 [Choiromyces venosus 120613-1]
MAVMPSPQAGTMQHPLPPGPLQRVYLSTWSITSEKLEGVARRPYHSPASFSKAIEEQAELQLGNVGQYTVFCPVTQEQLTKIDGIRETRYKSLRFMYLKDAVTLIVKLMPGQLHGVLRREFSYRIKDKIRQIGQRRELVNIPSFVPKSC